MQTHSGVGTVSTPEGDVNHLQNLQQIHKYKQFNILLLSHNIITIRPIWPLTVVHIIFIKTNQFSCCC